VLLLSPPVASEVPIADPEAVRARVAELVSAGEKRSAAVKRVSDEMGLARNEVYDLAHEK
jgi:hypothetical protein